MLVKYGNEDLSEADAQFFFDMLPYASPHVLSIERTEGGATVECAAGRQREVEEKVGQLRDMITKKVLSTQEAEIKTLVDRSDRKTLESDPIFEAMVEGGTVREIASGSYGYSGIFLKVYEYFSRKVDEYGRSAFPDSERHALPVLYPAEGYEKGGYFNNFPHFIMFQTIMKSDMAVLDRFARDGTSDPSIFEEMATPANVLRHAACAPIYGFMENKVLADGEGRTFLVQGQCFRNEAKNAKELSRLNEFLMKEYVFVGDPGYCSERVERAHRIWDYWSDVFGVNCKVDTANDSFFASNYKMLSFFQLLGDSKQEFKWLLPFSGEYLSCSSVNIHRTHFTKPYNIRQADGSLCCSSCFAFGIERLSYALLAQKGLDPDKWDEPTAREVSSYVEL